MNANKRDFSEIKRFTVYYDLRADVCAQLLGLTPGSNNFFSDGLSETKISPAQLESIKSVPVANINQQVTFALSLQARSLPRMFAPPTAVASRNRSRNLFKSEATTQDVFQVPFPFERLMIELQDMGSSAMLFPDDDVPMNSRSEIYDLWLKNVPFVKYLTVWTKNRGGLESNEEKVLRIHVEPSMQLRSFVTNVKCKFVDASNVHIFEHLALSRMPLFSSLPDTILDSLQKVDLSYNKGLRDVSSLRRVHTLSLKGCEQVEDVSILNEVYSLNISDCPRILSISRLGKVKKLSIKGLKQLRDGLPTDNDVKELWVDIETFVTAGVPQFKDRNKRINIYSDAQTDFIDSSRSPPAYSHISFTKVSITFQDLRSNCDLTGIRVLVMERCKLPAEFTPTVLPELQRLLLLRCQGVQRIIFERLPILKVLKIDGCAELRNLSIEHELEVLELLTGAGVVNLTIRAPLKTLIAKGGSSLKLLDVMAPVGEYEVRGLKNYRMVVHYDKSFK